MQGTCSNHIFKRRKSNWIRSIETNFVHLKGSTILQMLLQLFIEYNCKDISTAPIVILQNSTDLLEISKIALYLNSNYILPILTGMNICVKKPFPFTQDKSAFN